MKLCRTQQGVLQQAPAQAIVEFALAATLIFFLLAAAIDLGLIFFTMQALRTAAQEGATFGSYPVVVYRDGGGPDVYPPNQTAGMTINRIDLYYPEIMRRVYNSGGTAGSRGFANLHDLNNNGRDDVSVDNLFSDYTSANAYIRIENLKNLSGPPQPGTSYQACGGNSPGSEFQNGGQGCWIRVTVTYDYRFLFPLAPAFGNTVKLRAYHLMPVRSPFYT